MHLRDDEGGVIVLRGASVGDDAKFAADYGSAVRGPELVRMRDELGMNAVRMLAFWEAVEPERGGYDDGYVARFAERVREARALGLHVIVDFHQDLFGAGFGMAGAPLWAADAAFYGMTRRTRRPWMLRYFDRGVMRAFDRFWRSEELQARYAAAVARVAARLAGEGVLFYELWNEPFWGTATPTWLERAVLPPFYERVSAAVFAVDPNARVGLAGALHTNIGLPTALTVRDPSRTVYAAHFYPPAVELGAGYDGDAAVLGAPMDRAREDATRLGTPLVFTEFGVHENTPRAAEFLAHTYDALDARMQSALLWQASPHSGHRFWDRDFRYNALAQAIARPYPTRIAGQPLGWGWNAATGVFACSWDGAEGSSTFVLPKLVFPKGARVECTGGTEAKACEISRISVVTQGSGRCRLQVSKP